MKTLASIAVGTVCGILSAFGVGGGSLLMVWLTAVLSLPQRDAQSINLLFFLPTAGAALLLHAKHALIEWRAVLPAALCGCFAAIGASLLASLMNPPLLKKLFGAFLLLVGIAELRKVRCSHEL